MGQEFFIVNLDKKEYFEPKGKFNSIMYGYSDVLCYLLASGYGKGMSEEIKSSYIGRWIGDKIVIIGDYSTDFEIPEDDYDKFVERFKKSTDIIGTPGRFAFYWYVYLFYKNIGSRMRCFINKIHKQRKNQK